MSTVLDMAVTLFTCEMPKVFHGVRNFTYPKLILGNEWIFFFWVNYPFKGNTCNRQNTTTKFKPYMIYITTCAANTTKKNNVQCKDDNKYFWGF